MLNVPTPTPLTQWQTSDGRVHAHEEVARCHEVFLAVKHVLPNHTDSKVAHSVITALAARFDFVERT